MEWDPEFLKLIKDLETKKPVVVCGDMNVAHNEIGDNHLHVFYNIFYFIRIFIRYC